MSETNTTDTTDAPLPIKSDPDDDAHEDFVEFAQVMYGVITTLEIIDYDQEKSAEIGWTQEKVDLFNDAFQTGQAVLNHEAFEEFKTEGWGALPNDLVEEVFETMAPLAHIYDVEMDAPNELLYAALMTKTHRRLGGGS